MNRQHEKVTAAHLARRAYLYIRQSTLRQVIENTESTRRQYDLRARATTLGWPDGQIVVIDSDQAHSGAERDRAGFQKLVTEVSLGHAGIVLGIEVSRLARNSIDWHRLLEICALTETLILDEDGIYNPLDFNDRLLLGLKGQMSEAELHLLRARLHGGILNRARRGALKVPLPIGLAYDPLDRVVLDPDGQIRNSIALLFDTFTRTGSATATVKHFREAGLLFPRRKCGAPHKGEVYWAPLHHSRVLQILHNARYAGAFVFGRTQSRRRPDGTKAYRRIPLDEVTVLLRDHHPGYISWERFETNQQQLTDNAGARLKADRRPPREGPALLQGLALCGVCGKSMTVRYHTRQERLTPNYLCQAHGVERASRICQSVPGSGIDRVIGDLLVELMTPATLEVTLHVQQELEERAEQLDVWRRQQVQRAQEEADIARLRYMSARPDNRMVVDILEAEWNHKLRALDEARRDYERRCAEDRRNLEDGQRERILALATDFPRLWRDPATPDRQRKRMVHLMIEDVTISRGNDIELGIRLRGGTTRRIAIPPGLPSWKLYATPPEVLADLDRLLDHHNDAEVAAILNRRGHRTGHEDLFHGQRVAELRRRHGLKPRYQRLRERGLLTLEEMAARLDVSTATIKIWRRLGFIVGHPWNDKPECLFEMPDNPPVKNAHKKRALHSASRASANGKPPDDSHRDAARYVTAHGGAPSLSGGT